MKRFIKDNRGQVLYAVIVAVMFVGRLSMTAMGLTLKNYQSAVKKQQHVSDYYVADAVAELFRVGDITADENGNVQVDKENPVFADVFADVENIVVEKNDNTYIITVDTVTIKMTIKVVDEKTVFTSWEVSYHAVETEQEPDQPS